MSIGYIDELIELVDLTVAKLDETSGALLVQCAGEFQEDDTSENFEEAPVFSQLGVVAVPADVDSVPNALQQKNAQGLMCRSVDDGVIIGMRDTRIKVTGVNPGEVKLHSLDFQTPSCHVHLKKDGAIEISGGQGHTAKITIDTLGRLTIESNDNINIKTSGSTIIIGDKEANKPYLELNNTNGGKAVLVAPKVLLGEDSDFASAARGVATGNAPVTGGTGVLGLASKVFAF